MAVVDEADRTPGLRERNRARTHDRIRREAQAAFAARGFDAVTVEEVAEAAEVSRSTLFRYFPTKEDLVLGSDAARLDALRAGFLDRPADEPVLTSLRHALVALADAYEGDRDELLARYRLIRATPALADRVFEYQSAREDALAAAIAARLPGDDLRPQVLAAAGMAVVRVAMRTWLTTDSDRTLSDVAGEALDALIHELAPVG